MRLLEYQAKQIFQEYGIPIPHGTLVTSLADLTQVNPPVVLKAQVPVGGRGKAGGIQFGETALATEAAATKLFKMTIKGFPVCALLAEERIEVNREMYLAVLYNKKTNLPMVMASATGGVDIEQIAHQNPGSIFRRDIDLAIGMPKWTAGHLAKILGVRDVSGLGLIAEKLFAILLNTDATLVEINPLGETNSGLVAMDAKIVLDDKAAFRHTELVKTLSEEKHALVHENLTQAEKIAKDCEITYIPLDGDIAMIADGAGTGMLTLDLIRDMGGTATNFCEMGGMANADIMEKSIEVVLADSRATTLLITLIGGMTRMDEMAQGIARYVSKRDVSIPIVVRMCGTQEEVGKGILHEIGIDPFDDLAEAVYSAVVISKGGNHVNLD